MAVTALNTIKNWFKTGLKPTQAQFWATWDSFFHKEDKIPIESVEGLQTVLDGKLSTGALPQAKIKHQGYWFDTTDNEDKAVIEVGNTFDGWNGNTYIAGKVVSLPITLPDDLYDTDKIIIAVNNDA
jgi:hypothetical protein